MMWCCDDVVLWHAVELWHAVACCGVLWHAVVLWCCGMLWCCGAVACGGAFCFHLDVPPNLCMHEFSMVSCDVHTMPAPSWRKQFFNGQCTYVTTPAAIARASTFHKEERSAG
jgi:hypothetical protein